MADDPSVRLRTVLAELRRVPDILGVTIARRDGILIAHALPKSMDPKKIAAMSAAIVGTSEMSAGEMGLGTFSQSIVDTNIGKMMATGAGEEAILVTMVRNEANKGLVVTHTLPDGVDPKIVAAMTAAIVGTSEMATIQLSQGRFVRAIVESEQGKLLSLGAGEEAFLVALVYDDANLGLVLMAMERAAKQVEEILRASAG